MASSHSAESSASEPAPGRGPNAKGLLVLLPDRIDVEEEAQFYDDIVDVSTLDLQSL